MASDVTTGVFTLAGAVIGGGGTFAVNWLTTRTQRLLALATRDHSILDRQYAEHREYLLRADRVLEALRSLFNVLGGAEQLSEQQMSDLRAEYLQLWTQFAEGRGAAELAGPEELLNPLLTLHSAIGEYADKVDKWWSAGIRTTKRGEYTTRCGALLELVNDRRSEYRHQALKSFGRNNTDGSRPGSTGTE